MYREKQTYDENRDYALRSRRIVFEKEMKRLKMLMYGGSIRVWPFMTNFWGEYSEEQTMDFVDQIIDEEHYQRMHDSKDGRHVYRLSFYRKLLYCMLRTLTTEYTGYWNGNIVGFEDPEEFRFSDVVFNLEDCSGELLDVNIVAFMKEFYEILAQKEIDLALLNSGPEMPEMTDEMLNQLEEEADAYEAYEDERAKELGIDMKAQREAEWEEEKLLIQQQKEEEERIRKTFPCGEHFCRNLEEILLYLQENTIKPAEFQEDLKELIFRFLSDRRLSVFDDEDSYIEVMAHLKRTIRKAQRYTEDLV